MLLVLNKMKNYFRSTRNITRLTIVLIAIEVAMILSGTYLLYSCNQNLQNAEEKRNYYQELAGELGDTSDFLTKQVRYFAVTGDIQYFYNYWYEAEITRTRENVVKEIKKSVIPESERNLLSNAKSYSDALMDLEIHSMQYTLKAYDIKADDFKDDDIIYSWIVRVLDKESWELYEESSSWRNKEKKDKEPVFLGEDIDSIKRKEKDHALKEKGINLLFGKVYKEYKENIESFVKQFQSKMDQRLNEEVRQAEKQEHRTIILQVIFVCCENCIMMVLLYFLNVLFVKPLENYTKEIEKSNVNNLPSVRAEGTWELEYFGNIFNQLARNLSSELSFRKQIEEVMRKAKEQADEANKMKSDFLSMVSHEIRTPLHAITGYLFLLEDSNLEPEQMEYVENAQFATNILLEEISEILDFSKIEAGKMLIENKNFNFRKLIREIKSVLENEAGTRGIELQFNVSDDIPEYLIGDPLRLKQVLTNLIYNGIKFTKVGFVKLCVDIQDKQSLDHIVLSFIVEDSGIGIKKEMQDKIFEAFTQSDASVTRKYGGTGLGLPISKKIVEMSSHEKYTITVESQEGVGSRFYFCMEFGIGKRSKKKLRNIENYQGIKKNISVLIVDDNRINLNVEEKIFAKLGCQADLEDNPFKLLERMDEKEYDIVFLDISMPEISGYEISREIRKYHKWDDTILIALSANVGQDVIEKSKESGMNDYLAKPFSIDELAELLDKYLGSKLSSDENVGGKINTEILEIMENVKLEDSVEKTENGIWHEENDKELPVNSEVERDSIVIDTDGLLELVNEDKNAVKQLFLIFIEDNADFMKNLQRNLVDKKFKEIRCEIHRMEGVAGNLHCYALVHALEKVHQDVRKKTIDEKKWKKLEEEFCKVINFMKQYTEEE